MWYTVKVLKYGPGMKAKRWYITECRHCHTIFKASEFDVTYVEKHSTTELNHPSPYYKVTCPVCEHRARYNLKGKAVGDENYYNRISEYVSKDKVMKLLVIALCIVIFDLCLEPFSIVFFPTWMTELLLILSLLTVAIILAMLIDEIV